VIGLWETCFHGPDLKTRRRTLIFTVNQKPPREYVENCWSIDAGSLVPLLADPGQSAWMTLWRGQLKSSVRVETIDSERIEIHFIFTIWGQGGESPLAEEPLHQPLKLARVAGRRGERVFFICPECNRFRSILYALPHFSCRVCHRLVYASQRYANNVDLAKALKRREELGGRASPWDPFPPKPAGMRCKTYEQLKAEDLKLVKPYLIEQILQAASWARNIAQRNPRSR
jgi:hypothetical protein